MRILLTTLTYAGHSAFREIECYLTLGMSVVANAHLLDPLAQRDLQLRYEKTPTVSFEHFDPLSPDTLLAVVLKNGIGFDAIVCPPIVHAVTPGLVQSAALSGNLQHRLRAIGCPNDSIFHLAHIASLAARCGVSIIHTPSVHAQSVAEYTITQMGFHARRMAYFYYETGRDGFWPHDETISSTHLLQGKTLGVIGGSGKDGTAIISLALRHGLRVVAVNSGSREGALRIRRLGAVVLGNIDDLLCCSDFISVNCRSTARTRGLIGTRQIELMKRGAIVINASGAEIFDKQAIMGEFSNPPQRRRIGTLILDNPFGGRRDSKAFVSDSDNAVLKRLGVLFTPRMAGYTADARLQAELALATYLDRFLRFDDHRVPIANREHGGALEILTGDAAVCELIHDIVMHLDLAAKELCRLRDAGLIVEYKPDGSPATNADLAAESIIRNGLRARGYSFFFSGEELIEAPQGGEAWELVVDGIDGTRNFRDRNYGWCISVAAKRNGITEIAVIHDAQCRETYVATRGNGTVLYSEERTRKLSVPSALPEDFSFSVGSFRVNGSTLTKMQIVEDIKDLGGRGREWGCVALAICAVARGGLGTFIQANSKIHDHIAGVLIAEEAGASVVVHAKSDDGAADIIVSHPSLSDRINSIFNRRTNGDRGK